MKKLVEFIKPGAGHGYSYFIGDKAELSKKDAQKVIELKIAKEVIKSGTKLPKDFPCADHLKSADITTYEQLKDYSKDQLIELDGIGDAYAERIIEEYNEWAK